MSVATFRDRLRSLLFPGVRRRYADRPLDVSLADLPAQWVPMPTTTHERLTYTVFDTLYEGVIWVAVAPTVTGDPQRSQVQADLEVLKDDILTELHGGITGFQVTEIAIDNDIADINGTEYDAVTVSVTAKGT